MISNNNSVPTYYVLYTIEYNNKNKTDCRMITLYDPEEEVFYYYGTRSRTVGRITQPKTGSKYAFNFEEQVIEQFDVEQERDDKYVQFSGVYPENKLDSYMEFYKLLNGKFEEKMTVEMHQIELHEHEYENVFNFAYMFAKLTRKTELYAYDNSTETAGSIMEKLDSLTSIV